MRKVLISNYLPKDSKLSLFGSGNIALQFLEKLNINGMQKILQSISYVFDNNIDRHGKKIAEIEILPPHLINNLDKVFIIVTCGELYYGEVKRQLEFYGLTEFKDFISCHTLSCSTAEIKNREQFVFSLGEFSQNGYAYKRGLIFIEYLQKLRPWVDEEKFMNEFEESMRNILFGTENVELLCIKIFCKDNKLYLKDACIEYIDEELLRAIINELLITEAYFFESDRPIPVIIDGGANIGLAIYYFKHLFPKAHVIAFEPVDEIYEICLNNIYRNQWENVKLYHYALDIDEGNAIINISSDDGLGSSLTTRIYEGIGLAAEVIEKEVQTKKLSSFINTPVEYLKLDIEGVETRVIRELGEKLKLVNHLFCEYHYGETVQDNSFLELIQMIENAGFEYQISKSRGYHIITEKRTMNYVGKKYSLNIWGKRKLKSNPK